MKNIPTNNIDAGAATPGSAEALPPAGLARRRFAKLGGGTAGVIMTLASPSGMAATACVSGSAATSHAVAYTHAPTVGRTCAGRPPGFYKNNPDGWPSDLPADTSVKFQDIFPVNSAYATLGSLTLMEVFEIGNDGGKPKKGGGPIVAEGPDPANVGRHFLAAYLNLKSDRANVLDEATLKRMWAEYQLTGGGKVGYYKPSATVTWYAEDIVKYFTTVTFHN